MAGRRILYLVDCDFRQVLLHSPWHRDGRAPLRAADRLPRPRHRRTGNRRYCAQLCGVPVRVTSLYAICAGVVVVQRSGRRTFCRQSSSTAVSWTPTCFASSGQMSCEGFASALFPARSASRLFRVFSLPLASQVSLVFLACVNNNVLFWCMRCITTLYMRFTLCNCVQLCLRFVVFSSNISHTVLSGGNAEQLTEILIRCSGDHFTLLRPMPQQQHPQNGEYRVRLTHCLESA